MRPAVVLPLLAALGVAPSRAAAQTAQSIEFGAITTFDDATVQLGFRAAPARANHTGADIFLATFPDALAHGILLLLMEADATYGVPLGKDLSLFPRAGLTLIAGGGGGGGGAAFGYNFGVGLLGRASPTLGVRIDYTQHAGSAMVRWLESNAPKSLSP